MTDPPAGSAAITIPLALAAASLVMRGIVLAGDAAIGATGPDRARELAGASRAGRSVARLKSDPDLTSATLRAALALFLAGGVLGAVVAALRLGSSLPPVVAGLAGTVPAWIVAVWIDSIARSLSSASPEAWALRTASLLLPLRRVLSPAVRMAHFAGDLLLRPAGLRIRLAPPSPPLEEIERLLTVSPREGAPEPALVHSLFEFGTRTVKDIAVPRTDVVAIAYGTSPSELVRLMVEEGHTRVPVYKGTLDGIVGIVHVKDLLPLLENPELIILDDLVRPVTFVPWNRPIGRAMRELQRKRQHMAVVVDEYGGMEGLVTLEDIVEQLVGDIRDEFDEEEPEVVQSADGVSLVRAEMRVGAFNGTFGVAVPEDGGYETLGGFLSSLAGAIPAEGDRFYYGGLELLVTRRDARRVMEVKVTRTGRMKDEGGRMKALGKDEG